VKVTVDALEAPGGAKQKVFWLDCAGDAVSGTTESGSDSGPAQEPDAGTGPATATTPAPAPAAEATAVLAGSAVRPLAASVVAARPATQGAGTAAGVLTYATSRTAGGAATAAAGTTTVVRPAVLPFTGGAALPALAALAALTLALGVGLQRAGRHAAR
jgi:hypothetical protein